MCTPAQGLGSEPAQRRSQKNLSRPGYLALDEGADLGLDQYGKRPLIGAGDLHHRPESTCFYNYPAIA